MVLINGTKHTSFGIPEYIIFNLLLQWQSHIYVTDGKILHVSGQSKVTSKVTEEVINDSNFDPKSWMVYDFASLNCIIAWTARSSKLQWDSNILINLKYIRCAKLIVNEKFSSVIKSNIVLT